MILVLLTGGNSETARKVVPWRGQVKTVHPLLQNVFVTITFNW